MKDISVPKSAFALGDGTTPEIGDTVDFEGAAEVLGTEGDTVRLRVTTINGQPVSEAKKKPAQSEGEDEDTALMDAAHAADEGPSY